MTSTDRLQIRTIIIGIILIPLTALSIYFIYGAHLFSMWPWLRFSVVMATLTYLWTYTYWFGHVTGEKEYTLGPVTFGFAIIPFDFLLMYPGTKTLGIYSDSHIFIFLFILAIIHGFGFYFIQREIQKYLHELTSS